MNLTVPTYVALLSEYFPEVRFFCDGDGTSYHLISSPSPGFPSQGELDVLKLTFLKKQAKLEVNKYRVEWMTDYFTYDNKQWDCDDAGLTNIIGMLLMGLVLGQTLPQDTVFRDHNNTNHPVDFTYMVYMAVTLMTFKKTVYSRSWEMKEEIDALTTIEAVQNYDITAGWPSK